MINFFLNPWSFQIELDFHSDIFGDLGVLNHLTALIMKQQMLFSRQLNDDDSFYNNNGL